MAKEKIDKVEKQLLQAISTAISENAKIPVLMLDREQIEMVRGVLLQNPLIAKNYSEAELYTETASFLSSLFALRPKNKSELDKLCQKFESSLEIKKKFVATFFIPNLINLPPNSKIGQLKIIDPPKFDKRLEEFVNFVETNRRYSTKGLSIGRVEFQSYTTQNVSDLLTNRIELPFAVLSLLFDYDLDTRDCLGVIDCKDTKARWYLEPHNNNHGWARYDPIHHANEFEALSSISLNKQQTNLDKKILRSIQVYGLSRLSHKVETRFLLTISALESLLLTSNDKDYLGTKLAEKISFLLKDSFEERLILYKLVKKHYAMRSKLVHEGGSNISEGDLISAFQIYRAAAFRLLKLREDYPNMELRSSDKQREGIEDYINKLRFG